MTWKGRGNRLGGLYFNPHSREGSDDQYLYWSLGVWDFNPHSREGSDRFRFQCNIRCFISIHTPAKGVTSSCDSDTLLAPISIHTPAKGVTVYTDQKDLQLEISIHTPAKGVTWLSGIVKCPACDFNPHSREGSDFRNRVMAWGL